MGLAKVNTSRARSLLDNQSVTYAEMVERRGGEQLRLEQLDAHNQIDLSTPEARDAFARFLAAISTDELFTRILNLRQDRWNKNVCSVTYHVVHEKFSKTLRPTFIRSVRPSSIQCDCSSKN